MQDNRTFGQNTGTVAHHLAVRTSLLTLQGLEIHAVRQDIENPWDLRQDDLSTYRGLTKRNQKQDKRGMVVQAAPKEVT